MAVDPDALLDAFIKEWPARQIFLNYGQKLEDTAAGKALLALSREDQASIVAAAVARIADIDCRIVEFFVRPDVRAKGFDSTLEPRNYLALAIRTLLGRRLPLSETALINLLEWSLLEWPADSAQESLRPYPLSEIVAAAESYAKNRGLTPDLVSAISRLVQVLRSKAHKHNRKFADRLWALVDAGPRVHIQPGEAWSDAALSDLDAMPANVRTAWTELLAHCQSATGGKPAAKWLKAARPLIDAIGEESFKAPVLHWLPLVDKPRTAPAERRHEWEPDQTHLIIPPHADLLKGLAWYCGLREDQELARALMALAVSAYRKVPGRGPRAVTVGNACVTALGMMPGLDAVGALALLKVKVKFGTTQKEVEKALNTAAAREGLPRDEIEEMAVPAYGLEDVGRRRESFGDYVADLIVDGSAAELRWSTAAGKPLKSVPAAVKKEHADDLKELQAAVKDVARMLPAQRERLDGLFLQQRSWPFPVWRERYLDHPLVGTLARRLIWQFTTGKKTADGIFHGGRLVDSADRPLPEFGNDTPVSLWHPIGRPTAAVLAWREWLERHQVRQPFKQAHRELYVLTDAERATRVYSNRYAAHVLRQHQFNALAAVRGWKHQLRLMVDNDYPPASRQLPGWGLRAEFWVEGAGDEYGRDTNDAGTFLHLLTDQVRFYPLDAAQRRAHASGGGYHPGWRQGDAEPVPLDEIPPLVFSEVMRDVDLFVGVASVGNDPTWADGGPQGRYRDYWRDYSFGELSATARTRQTVLERLVPRLTIAERCSFADRFLVVRGDLRTYKIHLGSGNILMSPNDQYLCIVPKQGRAAGDGDVFLPFEGDATLSVILSKAFLLAGDAAIQDPTITSQIKRS
jgi:hypothetical protein